MKRLFFNRLKQGFFKNIANIITTIGLLAAVWLLVIALSGLEQLWLILLLAGVVGLSDLFDGWTARRLNIKSNFGSALDRLRDKIFICPILIILVHRWPAIPIPTSKSIFGTLTVPLLTFTTALIALIVLIEILLIIMGIFGLVKKLDVSASQFGRTKTLCQFIAVMIWLISLNVGKYLGFPLIKFSICLIDLILVSAIYLAVRSFESYWQRYQH